jgi:hypothetical protein
MMIIRAAHVNGYVKCALLRSPEEVAATVASLESAGHWLGVCVEPFVPMPRKARKEWR